MLTSLVLLALTRGAMFQGATTPATATRPKAAPIELYRRYTVGEKLSYAVKATYVDEERSGELITFLPTDVKQEYGFTLDVLKLKNDGFAEARYRRPVFKFTIGDTAESGPKTTTMKLNQVFKMTLSPVNEPTDLIDETPKKKEPKKPANYLRVAGRQADGAILYLLQGVIQEIQSLSFFTGGFDASLDLSPKLPVEEIAPGDTWKRTVGYAPQKLKGEAKKVAPQRLDYTYTYEGIVTVGKIRVHRVTAKLSLKTDVAEFGRQLAGERADIITKVPVTLDADIQYDLDLKTRHTIRAIATSRNSMQIYIKGYTAPVQESRAKGQTTLSLLSRTVGTAIAKPRPRR